MNQYSTNEMTAAGQRRITVVGVDLGKTWIEVCGEDASGKVRLTGKHRPAQFKALMAQLPACLVGLEACGRSHHWGAGLAGVRSRGEVDGATVCEAVCAVEQE